MSSPLPINWEDGQDIDAAAMNLVGQVVNEQDATLGAATPIPADGVLVEWDANLNLSANNVLTGLTITATSGIASVLSIESSYIQVFTGSAAQTVKLATTSVPIGFATLIVNQSSAAIAIETSSSFPVVSMATGTAVLFIALQATPTTALEWQAIQLDPISVASGKAFVVNNSITLDGTDGTTLTFPGASDTIVGVAAAQAISGKTLTLVAGTTSVAPLVITSGVVLTTAAAGAIEYDGKVFYATAAASSRQVIDAEQFATLTSSYTLTSQTAAQQLFNTTFNGGVTLPAGTYFFECLFTLSSMSASSGAFGFALGGTATIAGQLWTAYANKTALSDQTGLTVSVNTGANTALVTANTTQTGYASISGKVRLSASGTLIPEVSLGVAAAAVVGVDSYFRIWQIGTNTVTHVGNWS